MTARAPLAILLLAALGLAAWLALRGERTPRAPRAETPAGDAAAAAPASPIRSDLDARGSAATADAARVPVASRESAAPPAMLEMLVVDAESKQPVAEAEVWVVARAALPPGPGDPKLLRNFLLRGIEESAREHGRQYRTGDDGRARVEYPGSGTAVARAGERYGETLLGDPARDQSEPIRIELFVDRTLRLRAIDPDGAPVAGLLLSLRHWVEVRQESGSLKLNLITSPLGWTDSDGRLAVHHVQRWIPRLEADPDTGRRTAQIVQTVNGFDDEARVTIDAEAWPREELQVPVPAYGSIVVELRGGSVERAAAILETLGEGPNPLPGNSEPFGSDRRARFSPVALGKRFRVMHARAARIRRDMLGPVRPGQTVDCVLEVDVDPPELRYRLVDDQRRPLAGIRPSLRPKVQGIHGYLVGAESDANGIAYCTLRDWFLGKVVESFEFELAHPPLRGRVELGRELQPGMNDLGDVVLAAPPLLATGTVTGAPVDVLRSSRVFVEAWTADLGTGELQWRGLEGIAMVWPGGDRFELRGDCTATLLRATLLEQRLAPQTPVEFTRGDRDVRIELAEPGGIEVRLLTDEGIEAAAITARATAADGQRLPGGRVMTRSGPQPTLELDPPKFVAGVRNADQPERLQWSGLASGRYRIELIHGLRPLLAPIEATVRAGETMRAPDVDLRGRLKRIRLELQDQNGVRLPQETYAAVLHRRSEPDAEWLGEYGKGGRLDWLLSGPTDLAVFAEGFRRMDLDGVFEDRVVRLVPGPRVRIRFDSTAVQLPADMQLRASLERRRDPTDGTRYRTPFGSGTLSHVLHRESLPLGSTGTVTFRLEEPGEYSISVRLDRPSASSPTPNPRTIHVTDAPEQQFEVRLR